MSIPNEPQSKNYFYATPYIEYTEVHESKNEPMKLRFVVSEQYDTQTQQTDYLIIPDYRRARDNQMVLRRVTMTTVHDPTKAKQLADKKFSDAKRDLEGLAAKAMKALGQNAKKH